MTRADHDERLEDELRIALAMRGGVSLAVWIGGATAEIGHLCTDPPRGSEAGSGSSGTGSSGSDDGSAFWADLRRVAGYGNVIVDIMSGASAGGLNAVIGAASMVYGFPLDGLRDVWLEVADFGNLLRPAPGEVPSRGLPSLMQGDEYFLAKLRERLVQFAENGTPAQDPPRIDVTVVGTLLQPIVRERIRGDADTAESRFTTIFRFRSGRPTSTDFPTDDAEARTWALERLALAGRATSSFPGAFEAARVASPRAASFTESRGPTVGGYQMTGVFGEASASGGPFWVMDGGVLDNIPIGRAIDAIMDAPASRPTRRVLIYVQPDSAGTAAAMMEDVNPRSTAAVLDALVKARILEETIAGDLQQLEAHNRRAKRVRANVAAAVASLGMELPTTEQYRKQRAAVEADGVVRLLDDPVAAFGCDPFPMVEGSSGVELDALWRSPVKQSWGPRVAAGLPAALSAAMEARLAVDSITSGAGPLRRLAQLLIDACRCAHQCTPADDRGETTDPNDLKAALYRVLTVHRELVERPRALAWTAIAATVSPADPPSGDEGEVAVCAATWSEDAVRRVESITCSVGAEFVTTYLNDSEDPERSIRGADTTGTGDLARADLAMMRGLDALLAGQELPSYHDDIRGVLWARVREIAAQVLGLRVDADAVAGRAARGDVGARVLEWLRGDSGGVEDSLRSLEIAVFDAATAGEFGAHPVDFIRLSGANRSPLAAAFPRLAGKERLRDDQVAERLVSALSAEPPDLSPKQKLAGNDLMNFSAFLRRQWRANDWMWGRLDAVPTMVEVMLEPARLKDRYGPAPGDAADGPAATAARLRSDLQRLVCASGRYTRSAEWHDFLLSSAWAPRATAIGAVVDRIARGELVSAADMMPVRDALVASRQWDIVAELMPEIEAPANGDPPALDRSQDAIVKAANDYWVGVQTLREPADPHDKDLIRKLVVAARGVLAEATSKRTMQMAFRVAGSVVGALSWAWLKRSPAWLWRPLLLLLGIAGLSLPAYLLQDGGWKDRLPAAAAGPAGVLFVVGVVVFAVGFKFTGVIAAGVAVVVGVWACTQASVEMLAYALAPVGALALIAGVVLHGLIRANPLEKAAR